MKIKVKKLNDDSQIPTYANVGDAGADLYLYENQVILWPGKRKLVSTGIAVEVPEGYVGLIHPRSGLAHKHGVTIVNTPGTVDSGYRGELKVNLVNTSSEMVELNKGDRIAQFVVQKVESVEFEVINELSPTERSDRGHGSSGR